MKPSLMWLLLICFALFSCTEEQVVEKPKKEWSIEHSIDFNQELHEREELAIEIYLAHHNGLKMTKTGSGIRYQFAQNNKGSGDIAKTGDLVKVNMKIELLDGRICYETDSIPDRFVLGLSDDESGLHEVLQLMKPGDNSKVIIPSYLGHGLLGDSKRIPPQSILLIDVELLSTNE